jgi:hypothetical protein
MGQKLPGEEAANYIAKLVNYGIIKDGREMNLSCNVRWKDNNVWYDTFQLADIKGE